jgi:hypothetical protein
MINIPDQFHKHHNLFQHHPDTTLILHHVSPHQLHVFVANALAHSLLVSDPYHCTRDQMCLLGCFTYRQAGLCMFTLCVM